MRNSLHRAAATLAAMLALGAVLTVSAGAAEIKDAESATHGDAAASYQVVDTYQFPGFKIVQLNLAVLSHYSYLLVSGNECLVIDPGRDVAAYLETVKAEGATIRGVWLSHSHADFVAGHMELAHALNVPVWISAKAGAAYEHKPLAEGDTLAVGEAVVKFLETPGHTPDSMCALVAGKQAPEKPLALLSGDTLFIGSVGRPDLMGGTTAASTLASMMFDTWTQKLSKLPDEVMILPAHGAGSLCGAHLSDEPVSTIGQQRTANPYLAHKGRGEFIAAVLEGLPEAPQYFKHNAAMNRQGPELVEWKPGALPLIAPDEALTDASKYYVVDLRAAGEYFAGHVPNSVNIGLRGRFETWTGIMVPWDSELVLFGGDADLQEAVYRLHRVGYKAKCLAVEKWKEAGLPSKTGQMIPPEKLYEQMQSPESPIVVDVRLPAEWTAVRIGTVVNFPLNQLATLAGKLDPAETVVAVCNSAYRSTMAVGIFERAGFEHASSLAGGGEAWIAAGLPVFEATKPAGPGATPTRQIRLAERISSAELKRLMMDLPGTYQIVDVRPAEHFADYSLPGSANVDVAELLGNPAYLTGVVPLIVVDRDGSLAMMLGGILSQKTERSIKVLYGGLTAYWSESDLGAAATPLPGPRAPAAGRVAPARPAQPAAPTTPTKKKKSAGC